MHDSGILFTVILTALRLTMMAGLEKDGEIGCFNNIPGYYTISVTPVISRHGNIYTSPYTVRNCSSVCEESHSTYTAVGIRSAYSGSMLEFVCSCGDQLPPVDDQYCPYRCSLTTSSQERWCVYIADYNLSPRATVYITQLLYDFYNSPGNGSVVKDIDYYLNQERNIPKASTTRKDEINTLTNTKMAVTSSTSIPNVGRSKHSNVQTIAIGTGAAIAAVIIIVWLAVMWYTWCRKAESKTLNEVDDDQVIYTQGVKQRKLQSISKVRKETHIAPVPMKNISNYQPRMSARDAALSARQQASERRSSSDNTEHQERRHTSSARGPEGQRHNSRARRQEGQLRQSGTRGQEDQHQNSVHVKVSMLDIVVPVSGDSDSRSSSSKGKAPRRRPQQRSKRSRHSIDSASLKEKLQSLSEEETPSGSLYSKDPKSEPQEEHTPTHIMMDHMPATEQEETTAGISSYDEHIPTHVMMDHIPATEQEETTAGISSYDEHIPTHIMMDHIPATEQEETTAGISSYDEHIPTHIMMDHIPATEQEETTAGISSCEEPPSSANSHHGPPAVGITDGEFFTPPVGIVIGQVQSAPTAASDDRELPSDDQPLTIKDNDFFSPPPIHNPDTDITTAMIGDGSNKNGLLSELREEPPHSTDQSIRTPDSADEAYFDTIDREKAEILAEAGQQQDSILNGQLPMNILQEM